MNGKGDKHGEGSGEGRPAVLRRAGDVFHLGAAGGGHFVDLVGTRAGQGVRRGDVLAAVEEDVSDGPGAVREGALGCARGSWCRHLGWPCLGTKHRISRVVELLRSSLKMIFRSEKNILIRSVLSPAHFFNPTNFSKSYLKKGSTAPAQIFMAKSEIDIHQKLKRSLVCHREETQISSSSS